MRTQHHVQNVTSLEGALGSVDGGTRVWTLGDRYLRAGLAPKCPSSVLRGPPRG